MYVIYLLSCLDDNVKDSYVGSTKNIKTRMGQHKSSCNNPNNNDYQAYKYNIIRIHGGFDNWKFEILEEVDIKITNLLECEAKWITALKPTLNIQLPFVKLTPAIIKRKTEAQRKRDIFAIEKYTGHKVMESISENVKRFRHELETLESIYREQLTKSKKKSVIITKEHHKYIKKYGDSLTLKDLNKKRDQYIVWEYTNTEKEKIFDTNYRKGVINAQLKYDCGYDMIKYYERLELMKP